MNVPSTRIARLKAEIAAGRVVILTGTGVSVAACGNQEIEGHKVATWQGLLEHGAHHLKAAAADDKVVTLLMGQIESGETDLMIAAAETIERRMRAKSDGTFRGWLKDTIGQLTFKDDPETLPWLKTCAQSDPNGGVRQSEVYVLALCFKDDPETLPWLKSTAQSDPLGHVRQSAVHELIRAFKDNPEILAFLQSLKEPTERPIQEE